MKPSGVTTEPSGWCWLPTVSPIRLSGAMTSATKRAFSSSTAPMVSASRWENGSSSQMPSTSTR